MIKTWFRWADTRFWVPLVLIVGFAAFLRLYALGDYPVNFGHDEAQIGYDAWSIWQTGRDHHGARFPIHFQAFNDYGPGATDYLTAPFVGLLGLTETATRLPLALMGIATVFLTGLLGRRWFGPLAGLLAALLLAIEPWHLSYSRINSILSDVPFLQVAMLYCFTRATAALQRFHDEPLQRRPRRPIIGWFAAAAFFFALMPFSYHTMKLHGPILLGICLVSAAPLLWHHKRITVLWLALCLLLASPVYLDDLLRYNIIHTRFNGVSAIGAPYWGIRAIRLYADHYSPGFLFFTGYGGGVAPERPALFVGELFWPELFLWMAAFYAMTRGWLVKRTAFSAALLVTSWFLAFPIADSLTIGDAQDTNIAGNPNESRSIDFLPLPELLAGCGAAILWEKVRQNRLQQGRWRRWIPIGAVVFSGTLYGLFAVTYLHYYFGPPILDTDDPHTPVPYNVGLRPILLKVLAEAKTCDTIYVDPIFQAYMRVMFAVQYPPQLAQRLNLGKTEYGWLAIGDLDHFGFIAPDAFHPVTKTGPECANVDRSVYYATRSADPWPGWTEIAGVRKKIGTPVWRLLVKPLPFFHDGRINASNIAQTMAGYCLPDNGIAVYAIDDEKTRKMHFLFKVTADEIQETLAEAIRSGKNLPIGSAEDRALYANQSNELQFHDLRGVYDYLFDPAVCSSPF